MNLDEQKLTINELIMIGLDLKEYNSWNNMGMIEDFLVIWKNQNKSKILNYLSQKWNAKLEQESLGIL